jgi:hypothetical protein
LQGVSDLLSTTSVSLPFAHIGTETMSAASIHDFNEKIIQAEGGCQKIATAHNNISKIHQ